MNSSLHQIWKISFENYKQNYLLTFLSNSDYFLYKGFHLNLFYFQYVMFYFVKYFLNLSTLLSELCHSRYLNITNHKKGIMVQIFRYNCTKKQSQPNSTAILVMLLSAHITTFTTTTTTKITITVVTTTDILTDEITF